MAQIRIECLVGKTNKGGVTSWYWQPSSTLAKAGWKAIALGKDAGAAITAARKRNAEVESWKEAGSAPAMLEIKVRCQAGTFGALIDRYDRDVIENGKKDNGEPQIAKSTARTYRTSLKRLRLWASAQPLAYITPLRVKALRKAMMAPAELGGIGHHSAHQTLKMGRTLFAFAESEDIIAKGSNPFANFGLGAPPPRDIVWSPPARELMVLTAYELGMPSMATAIMLGFAIGQREQDMVAYTSKAYVAIPEHKMQPEDYRTLSTLAEDGIVRGIRFRQKKTRAWIEVPIVGNVRWAVEANIESATAAGSVNLLIDDRRQDPVIDYRYRAGASYADGQAGQTRFQRDFAEVREWAVVAAQYEGDVELAEELATLQFMDLRRTCVVYLGELGMDAHLIAGVTGHDIDETQRILKTYMPRTTGRAARAIALASAREARPIDAKEKIA